MLDLPKVIKINLYLKHLNFLNINLKANLGSLIRSSYINIFDNFSTILILHNVTTFGRWSGRLSIPIAVTSHSLNIASCTRLIDTGRMRPRFYDFDLISFWNIIKSSNYIIHRIVAKHILKTFCHPFPLFLSLTNY